MRSSAPTVLAVLSAAASAQNITIPATSGSLPAAGSNGCAAGYYPGVDTVIYTVPYTYQQVLSIIGNYTNLTWSGSPENSVTTNNSAALASNDWTPGSARTYDIAGAHVIETITTYSKPANGPYVESHTVAPLRVPSANVSFYSDIDAQVWTPVCDGKATWTNFTIKFCATNATTAAAVLHQLHSTDAITVGQFLGGKNFTTCAALGAAGASPVPSNGTIGGIVGGSNGTSGGGSGATGASPTTSAPPETTTSAGMRMGFDVLLLISLFAVALAQTM